MIDGLIESTANGLNNHLLSMHAITNQELPCHLSPTSGLHLLCTHHIHHHRFPEVFFQSKTIKVTGLARIMR